MTLNMLNLRITIELKYLLWDAHVNVHMFLVTKERGDHVTLPLLSLSFIKQPAIMNGIQVYSTFHRQTSKMFYYFECLSSANNQAWTSYSQVHVYFKHSNQHIPGSRGIKSFNLFKKCYLTSQHMIRRKEEYTLQRASRLFTSTAQGMFTVVFPAFIHVVVSVIFHMIPVLVVLSSIKVPSGIESSC